MISIHTIEHPAEQALKKIGWFCADFVDGSKRSVLRRHLEYHRYWKNREQNRHMTWEEAVDSWLDEVWGPIIETVDQPRLQHHFSDKSRWDVYVEISEYWHFLKNRTPEISAGEAAWRYAAGYGRGGWSPFYDIPIGSF